MTDSKSNTGNWNTGNWNTGYSNTGDWNTGDWNTGGRNTGYSNTGGRNTGNWNTGNWNTGNWNTGNWNTGNWNTGNWNTGFFNTDEPSIRIFGKDTDLTRAEIAFPDFFYFDLTEWVLPNDMTDEEKAEHPLWETTQGYLKSYEYKEAWGIAWGKASQEEKDKVFDLPNFDADMFEEITGINVNQSNALMEVNGVKYRVSDVEKALSSLEPA